MMFARGWPISTPACHLDPQKYAAAKAEFEYMEKASIVQRSNTPWYQYLTSMLFTNNMAGSSVFSTLDLVKGYYQVP